ncbi:hypothetical protein [uncultured Robinsoniella sp.]|uniref:hypothetical protein n=1 Tax=uncultured Robinsoniella sp. TaxID=904190 RepID=UPI00374E4F6B
MQEVKQKQTGANQIEDSVMKTMVRFFADEMLPYLGIKGKVKMIAPTEEIHMEIKRLYEDMNLIMEDGTWKHFEFQSTNGGITDLKRFRVYEAITSQENKVPVVTYVLFSGKIKNPQYQFTEGINTYRVIPIIMQDKNADRIINKLLKKQARGKSIERQEMVALALTPLMQGKIPMKDRIKNALQIVGREICLKAEEAQKIQAVIYALAEKFLKYEEMNEVKEVMNMTRLGQMLVDDGISQGIVQGLSQGLSQGKAEAIVEFLGMKGTVSDDLRQKIISEKDVDKLSGWIRIAAASNSVDDFQKLM